MRVAKLTISYERGLSRNTEKDLGEDVRHRGAETTDGKIIRGHGTHFKSAEDQRLVKERDKDAGRIRSSFRERFLATPIDGLYVVAESGDAERYVSSLGSRSDIHVRVVEFDLTAPGEINETEVVEWGKRIQRQLGSVSLGRKKQINESGLTALEALSKCPVLSKNTGGKIRNLVGLVRSDRIDRVELKRRIDTLDVEIDQGPLIAPRRAPVAV